MNGRLVFALVAGFSGLFAADADAVTDHYDYPFDNPYVATVVNTPPDQRAEFKLPDTIDEGGIEPFAERVTPDVFWYADELRYLTAIQDRPAPLVFVISGTGSNHKTPTAIALASTLYAGGAHVVTLPSPTQMNFIVAASTHSRPGYTDDDVDDLLRVMTMIRDDLVADGTRIDGYGVTGYSMGAFHAAMVGERDSRDHVFDFDRVVLVNAPVSLYESAMRLDRMLLEGIPGGMAHFDRFYEEFTRRLANIYAADEGLDFTGDFLYRIYEKIDGDVSDQQLKALIGLSFRLIGSNLAFTSDVMNHAGYVVSPDLELGVTSRLDKYFKVLGRLSFSDYVEELFFPLFEADHPGIARQRAIERSSLRSIEDYMRNNANVFLLHNRDDIILGEGDIPWFESIFGDRATIFPNGGHMGNVYHHAFIATFASQFDGENGR